MSRTAANDESAPFLKTHDNETICFADNLEQTVNALSRGVPEEDKAKLDQGHLLMFGVENWDNAQIQRVNTAMSKSLNTFKRIEVFGCEIAENHFKEFAKGFRPDNIANVERVDIDNTKLTRESAKDLFENLSESAVSHLNLQGSIPDEATMGSLNAAFVEGVNILKSLSTLDLKLNSLKAPSGAALSELIAKLGTERECTVDLFYNELGAEGAANIANGLQSSMITHLDLCCNKIGDDGAKAIARALRVNTSLRTLKLALNEIKFEGGVAIMSALSLPGENGEDFNKTLEILDLSANEMKEVNEDENEGNAVAQQMQNVLEARENLRNNQVELKKYENRNEYGFEDLSDEDRQGIIEACGEELVDIDRDVFDEQLRNLENRNAELNEAVKGVADNSLVGSIVRVITAGNNLTDFDFTGIELSPVAWGTLALCLEKTITTPKGIGTEGYVPKDDQEMMIIRFSIVDLMNQENLKVMEKRIWEGDLDKQYKHIDWRRPKKREEPATDANATAGDAAAAN